MRRNIRVHKVYPSIELPVEKFYNNVSIIRSSNKFLLCIQVHAKVAPGHSQVINIMYSTVSTGVVFLHTSNQARNFCVVLLTFISNR